MLNDLKKKSWDTDMVRMLFVIILSVKLCLSYSMNHLQISHLPEPKQPRPPHVLHHADRWSHHSSIFSFVLHLTNVYDPTPPAVQCLCSFIHLNLLLVSSVFNSFNEAASCICFFLRLQTRCTWPLTQLCTRTQFCFCQFVLFSEGSAHNYLYE